MEKEPNIQTNELSRNFNAGSLIKYALPTIIMMVFMSTYSVIDGSKLC